MAELIGSEKQVKWAKDIRTKMLEMLARVQANHPEDEAMATAIGRISRKMYASWYIDHRLDNPTKLLRQVDYELPQISTTSAPTISADVIARHDFDGIANHFARLNDLASL